MYSREKAKRTKDALLSLTTEPCLEDHLGEELSDEELHNLQNRIEDAVEEEIYTTLKEQTVSGK